MPLRVWALVLASALLIAVNWGIYIWAVNAGHVVDAALGYFINPLVTVLFGVLIFRERLRPTQWAAVGCGAAAVAVLAVAGGVFPWVALSLAASFACYGLVKKVIPLPPTASLTAEGLVQLLPALGYLVFLTATGTSTMKIQTSASTAKGAKTLTVRGVSGSLNHTFNVVIQVKQK